MDRLESPEWLGRFLAHWRLQAPLPPGPGEVSMLKDLRSRLRRMTNTLMNGESLTKADLEMLNQIMADGPVVRRIVPDAGGYRLEHLPSRDDWSQVMAEIAASFSRTLVEGEAARLRICENPDCQWLFYDDTRNRSKRFCEERTCGNLMKVRRFRARQREIRGSGSGDSGGGN